MSSSINACSDILVDQATNFVDLGWTTFIPLASQAYDLATSQANALNNFTVTFHEWDASFTATGELSGFQRPDVPELVNITPVPNVAIPPVPDLSLAPIVLENAPEEPSELSNLPSIQFPTIPAELDATRPGDAPELTFATAPTAPTLTDPTAPTLEEITVPDAPDLAIEPFSEDAPEFSAPVPSDSINFTETAYSSALSDTVRSQLTAMIGGSYYLPTAVQTALWDAAIARDERISLAALQQSRDLHGIRGFEEPDGNLDARQIEIIQRNADRKSDLSRDVYTKAEQEALANLRFAVQQGIAFEGMFLQAHLQVQERRFQLAVKLKDVQLAIFNAHVQTFNAAVAAYNARVDAYRAYLDGLRAEVDVYRAQVEAAKVRGEINEQRVRVYAEQVRANLSRAEAYRAQIEGYRASIDGERARIEAYQAQVTAYRAVVESYGIEWDAYKSRVLAETEKVRLFETLGRVYGVRIDAWKTRGEVAIEEQRSNFLLAEARLKQFGAQTEVVRLQLDASRALMASEVAQNEASVRLYEGKARVESAAVDADSRAFAAETERSRVQVELALKDADLQIRQLVDLRNLLLRALETSAQTSSQLAASSLSALNFSSTVSSSLGRSRACNTSFSYSGDIADSSTI